ncbi:MAG: hypothetical protein ACI9F9_000349 [Candidatus Paceibacteria bacterium]|jgi:hypothetical protein
MQNGIKGLWTTIALVCCLYTGPLFAQEPAPGLPEVSPVLPARMALLVGCTEYPSLEAALPGSQVRLEGPGHDVALFARTLRESLGLQEESITRLSGWGEDFATRPTRDNILAALDQLAEDAKEGDWVCIFLAGHGTQQPTNAEDEIDLLDEVFLPADAGASMDRYGHIPNSITDDEIGIKVGAIREAGAQVWFVADCCHSGSLVRGEDAVMHRGLAPSLFKQRKRTQRKARKPRSLATQELDGITAMYAVESDQQAPEMHLPVGSEEGVMHGLFTYLLCQELTRGGSGMTYDELHGRLVAAYQAQPYRQAVPSIEGDRLRVIATGEARTAPALLAEVTAEEQAVAFNLGSLAGVERGAIVELYASGSYDGAALARVEITASGPFSSHGDIQGEKLPAGLYFSKVVQEGWSNAGIQVALVDLNDQPLPVEGRDKGLLRQLESLEGSLRLVVDPSEADWLIVCGADDYWVRPSALVGGLDLGRVEERNLARAFRQIVKVRGLVGLASRSSQGLPADLELVIERRAGERKPVYACTSGDRLVPGEQFRVGLTKTSAEEYDVTVLYVDATFGVTCLFPRGGRSARLVATEHQILKGKWFDVVDTALGTEHVLVLAVPRQEGDVSVDFSWLARESRRTRGGGDSPLSQYLMDLTVGAATRGAPSESADFQHAITTLRTQWRQLQAPAWRRASIQDFEAAEIPDGPLPFPRPLAGATRIQKLKAGSRDFPVEMRWAGGEHEVTSVYFDLTKAGESSTWGPGDFDGEAAFRFAPEGNYAYYDQFDSGEMDLVLLDAEGDGVAECSWTKVGDDWKQRKGIQVPWLSQANLKFLSQSDSVAVAQCFAILSEAGP